MECIVPSMHSDCMYTYVCLQGISHCGIRVSMCISKDVQRMKTIEIDTNTDAAHVWLHRALT